MVAGLTGPVDCTADEFRCSNSQCIPASRQCDGHWDCAELPTDEMNCPDPKCDSDTEFRCKNSVGILVCIKKTMIVFCFWRLLIYAHTVKFALHFEIFPFLSFFLD